MKGKNLKERGITLIALVITIIVLLILAGVTLSIVLHTGIIENSQKAVDTYQAKAENEVKQLDNLTLKIQTQFGILDNTEGEENQTITGDKSKYNNPVIPVGFKTSNEGASWKSSDGETVDGWNSGLVIEDKDGNQFVWVPCYIKNDENEEEIEDIDKLVEYKKTLGTKNGSIITEENFTTIITDDTLPEGVTDEELQIKTYGGFYIARYEAGIPDNENMRELLNPKVIPNTTQKMANLRNVEGKPVSMKNQVPWNWISYEKSKKNAELMYTEKNVKSGLLTGKMWDTTLEWLIKTNAVTKEQVYENGSSWGNYRNSIIPGVTSYCRWNGFTGVIWENTITTKPGIDTNEASTYGQYLWILKTGNTEYTKRNNIYDLSGNLSERICERYKINDESLGFITRGGAYISIASNLNRGCEETDRSNDSIGFRVALYVK